MVSDVDRDGEVQVAYTVVIGPVNALELTPPNISSPSALALSDVVGSNKNPTSSESRRSCLKALSVTVGNVALGSIGEIPNLFCLCQSFGIGFGWHWQMLTFIEVGWPETTWHT